MPERVDLFAWTLVAFAFFLALASFGAFRMGSAIGFPHVGWSFVLLLALLAGVALALRFPFASTQATPVEDPLGRAEGGR